MEGGFRSEGSFGRGYSGDPVDRISSATLFNRGKGEEKEERKEGQFEGYGGRASKQAECGVNPSFNLVSLSKTTTNAVAKKNPDQILTQSPLKFKI